MISINATLIVQLLNFLVLIWILNRIMFRPILKVLTERENVVQKAKAESQRLKAEAEHRAQALETELESARRLATTEKTKLTSDASTEADAIIRRAQEQAQEHMQAVRAETTQEVDQTRERLAAYKQSIVELVQVKVLGRKLG